ncbi:uncharacterized protein LOC134701720 [Mytilus trossulus]|uniref:uncharacterized protein LOC134701720 n=1 Tax=Mytilus trossulus TaxID=6551 RepID=UPI003006453B
MLNKALDKHAPVVKKRVKRDRQPEWYNSEIIYARNMRDKYNALGLWSEYKFWRNKTKQIVDNSKKNYYKNMVKDSNDPKTLWKCLHSLNPKVKNTPYELTTEDNNTTKSKKCIADTFNNFFTSCAEKLRGQGSYTPVNKANFSNLSKFVKNKLHKHEKFSIPPVNMNELFNELAKLDINKASGMDNIGPKILRLSAPFIASPLTYIFNRMIDTGIYPSLLKNAKLKIYGFSEASVSFFKSYLNNRKQQVKICNVYSEQQHVKFGVPQGSILGPLLFVLFINDLPLCIENCETDLYADDTTLHKSGKNIENIHDDVQEDLYRVEEWCKMNNMFINANKTKCLVTGTKQKLSIQTCQPNLIINSKVLQNSSCEKLLGVKIDNTLNWKNQIDQVCANISSRIYLLSKIKKFLDINARKTYYNGYILPLIDYCCIIWGECKNEGITRILKLQKRAARLILDADPLSPSAPLFKKLWWMTVDNRIKYHKYLLLYKCMHMEAPMYLVQKFKLKSDNNPYSLRGVTQGNLIVSKPKAELFKKSCAYFGSVLWNGLPHTMRKAQNTFTFKQSIKKYLTHP